MPVAWSHSRLHRQEQIQAAVDLNQRHHLITAAPLITFIAQVYFLGIDRVVVLVEQQLHRVFIVFVVGNKNVTGVAQKQAFGIEQFQRPQATRHFPVEPVLQLPGIGIAGELPQKILIAGSLPAVGVLPVVGVDRWRRRQTQGLFQPIHRRQNLPVQFRQGHPALAEVAIVFRQAADAGLVCRGERPDASLAALTPRKHGRRMQAALWFGAVAGRVATARFQTVDGALDQLAMPENTGKTALILLAQIVQELPLAAGESGRSRGALLALHFACCSHKADRSTTTPFIAAAGGKVQRKVNGAAIIFLEARTRESPSIFRSSVDTTKQPRPDGNQKTTSALKILKADRANLLRMDHALARPFPRSPSTDTPNYLRLLRP